MKLFYFNPRTYGAEAFVCAESKEKAVEYLKASKPEIWPGISEAGAERENSWHQQKIEMMVNQQDGYTIDEFEPGEIVWSEIS